MYSSNLWLMKPSIPRERATVKQIAELAQGNKRSIFPYYAVTVKNFNTVKVNVGFYRFFWMCGCPCKRTQREYCYQHQCGKQRTQPTSHMASRPICCRDHINHSFSVNLRRQIHRMVLLYRKRQWKSTHAFCQERGALPPEVARGKRGNLSALKKGKEPSFCQPFPPERATNFERNERESWKRKHTRTSFGILTEPSTTTWMPASRVPTACLTHTICRL